MATVPFKTVPVGEIFTFNGNSWIKRSSMTARGFSAANYGKTVYFYKDERVQS